MSRQQPTCADRIRDLRATTDADAAVTLTVLLGGVR